MAEVVHIEISMSKNKALRWYSVWQISNTVLPAMRITALTKKEACKKAQEEWNKIGVKIALNDIDAMETGFVKNL